jgi:hypothetical protein
MTTKFFEWGNASGGSGSGGAPSAPAESNYGEPEPYTGTVAAGGTTITFTNATKSVTVRNTNDANDLEYSLDNGVTYMTLGPYAGKTEAASITTLLLRRVGGLAVDYEVVGILTS